MSITLYLFPRLIPELRSPERSDERSLLAADTTDIGDSEELLAPLTDSEELMGHGLAAREPR